MRQFILGCVVSLGLASAASADNLQAPSDWKNARGSELHIDSVDANGKIIGNFTNHATGFECKDMKEIVKGKVQSDGSLVFGSTFPECVSLVSWSGNITGKTMTTTWILVYMQDDGSVASIHDTDIFTQQ